MEIGILIIEPSAEARGTLARLLKAEPGFAVAGIAASAEEGMQLLETRRPGLVLLGLQDGLETLRRIKAARPKTRCILLSDDGRTEHLLEAFKAGADGYLLRSATPAVLCAKLRKAMEGITVVQEDLKQALIDSIRQKQASAQLAEREVALTPREREILDCLTRQLDNRTIAQMLGISVSTVKTHSNHVLAKLKLSKRPEDASSWASLLSRTRLVTLSAA